MMKALRFVCESCVVKGRFIGACLVDHEVWLMMVKVDVIG